MAAFSFVLHRPLAYATNTQAAAQAAVDDAQAAVDSSKDVLQYAQERLDAISDEFNELSSEIDDLQSQIDELSVQVLNAQQAMLDGRSLLSNTVIYEYQTGSMSTFLGVILGSTNWNEFTRNVDYINQIVNQQAQEIEEQKALRQQFTEASDSLTSQKDTQEKKLAELNQKREEATAVVDQAAAEVEENSEELEKLRKQAQTFIWQSKQGTPVQDSPEANTTDRVPVVSPNTPVIPDSTTNDIPASSSSAAASTDSTEGWRTGVASAYGGSSDPNTPNPGTTSNGSICNDTSMGVAIPLSWGDAEWQRLKGRTIEIKYNGMTVYATVNDRGGMASGARHLDLQPGVFKAFGYSTCYEWGLRTVTYRFL